ncbi:peptidoglycan DD-metalloendopeptidase family protein [Streptomyces sp. NPDC092296]|uniref:M23 family metallopeptidase n=1 Tax=Streptomyces sp. NPDC092296 TaxID=3366012 RepID=UPI0037F42D41
MAYEGHGAGAVFPPPVAPDPSYAETSYDATGTWYGYGEMTAEQTGGWAADPGRQAAAATTYGYGTYAADPTATAVWDSTAFASPDTTGHQYGAQDLYGGTGYGEYPAGTGPAQDGVYGYQAYAGYDTAPTTGTGYAAEYGTHSGQGTPQEAAPTGYDTAATGYGEAHYQATGYDTSHYGAAGYDTIPHQAAPYDTAQFETTQFETAQFETAQFDETAQFEAAHFDETAQFEAAPYDTAEFDLSQFDPADHPEHAGHPEHPDAAAPADHPGPADAPEPPAAGHPAPEPPTRVVAPGGGRAAARAARGKPRTARRSALLTIAVPSVAVMGVAAAAAVSVSAPDQSPSHETAAGASDSTALAQQQVTTASSKLDTQLAGLRKNADDFAGRVSRDQARIDLKKRQADEKKRKEEARPKFVLPVKQHGLSATFGMAGTHWAALHTGIDFPVSWGTSVHAATDGTVRTQWNSAYGYMVIVTASDGSETWYCHLSSYKIRSGKVKAGDVIAYSGSSGNSTGPHMHFEVHPGGEGAPAVDPIPWLLEHGLDPR